MHECGIYIYVLYMHNTCGIYRNIYIYACGNIYGVYIWRHAAIYGNIYMYLKGNQFFKDIYGRCTIYNIDNACSILLKHKLLSCMSVLTKQYICLSCVQVWYTYIIGVHLYILNFIYGRPQYIYS